MFNLAYPHLLYLLFAIPVLLGLFMLARAARKRKIAKFGKSQVLFPLMPDASKYVPWVKITLQLIIVALLIVIIARPRYGETEEVENKRGIEVMIAFDVSRSMLASSNDDPNGISRLQRAKMILEKLIDKLDNDKVGLVIFAGEAYTQLPVTSDFLSAKMYLNNLSTDLAPTQGTAIGQAIAMSLNGFTPDDQHKKAIVVITDGENHEGDAVEMAKKAKKMGIQVDVVGVGSGNGAPIPVDGGYLEYNGERVLTALNEQMAEEIADAGGGVYVDGNDSEAVAQVAAQLDKIEKSDFASINYKASAEQFPLFAIIALILMLIDTWLMDTKISWLRKVNFFTR